MSNKWWISELGIKTKTELVERIRDIVARTISVVEPDDTLFMIAVLRHHYEWSEKCGCGLHKLIVRNNGGNRGFWIARTDGTQVDISWVVALNGQPSSKSDAVAAARNAIAHQTVLMSVPDACDLCGKQFVLGDRTHVDHTVPFDMLFTQWMAERGETYNTIRSVSTGVRREMSDPEQCESWVNFHLRRAQLRVVHARCNLSRERTL